MTATGSVEESARSDPNRREVLLKLQLL